MERMPNASRAVGTAGWSVPRACADRFGGEGTHLQRYSRVLSAVEINSSFHRPHAAKTYARWAAATPERFRFSVKVPKAITHDQRLVGVEALLDRFLAESAGLGDKRGPLLVQLPPWCACDLAVVGAFFDQLRARYEGPVVCEPRHVTWLDPAADALLIDHRIARVAADPPRAGGDDRPGGWPGLVYYRWHGTPRTYWSRYDEAQLTALADAVWSVPDDVDAWCVFDNTASGAALENAFELQSILHVDA
jgi:uncharacterized protein YecE (DUF72 family)